MKIITPLYKNIGSLAFLKIANFSLQTITIVYLIRILGPVHYGILAFAQAFINILMIIGDYGYDLSGTRLVSTKRDNLGQVSEIFSTILFTRIGFSILCLLIIYAIIFVSPTLLHNKDILLILYLLIPARIFLSDWFYRGIEDMKYLSLIGVSYKLIATVGTVLLVNNSDQFLLAATIQSASSMIGGIASLIIIFCLFKIKLVRPSWITTRELIRDGWYLFISKIQIHIYANAPTLILGILTHSAAVGYYRAAQQIVSAAGEAVSPLLESAFPVTTRLLSRSKEKAVKFARKTISAAAVVGAVIFFVLFIGAQPIINSALGQSYTESIGLLRILAVVPLLVLLNTAIGVNVLIAMGYDKVYSKIMIVVLMLNATGLYFLVKIWQSTGAAIGTVITELVVLLLVALIAYKYRLLDYKCQEQKFTKLILPEVEGPSPQLESIR